MVSPTPPRFEPELEELLRDIARDPRSSLLRIERPSNPIDLADSWEALSRWTPGLTAAEKHLLDVHRAETAQLLRERWWHEVTARPRAGYVISARTTLDGEGLAAAEDLTRRRKKNRLVLLSDSHRGLADALSGIDEDRALDSVTLTRLLVMAERIEPATAGKIMLGQDLVMNQQHRSAALLLVRTLQHEVRPWLTSYLWHGLSFAFGSGGDLRRAHTCCARASQSGDHRMSVLGDWLLLAVQNGQTDSAFTAAQHVESLVAESSSLLVAYCAAQRRARVEGLWSPTLQSVHLLPRLQDKVGDSARRLLDVLV